jgi:hypothetical protein
MNVQTQNPSKVSALASLVVVLLCLIAGGLFVWWYLGGSNNSATIKLSASDLAGMQDAGRLLLNPAMQNGGGQPFQRRVGLPQQPMEPDGIFAIGNWQVIRAGRVLVRVQPSSTAGAKPTMTVRQRTWGLLQDPPTFTIARRIVHEPALAKQLAVTPQQLQQLAVIVATPPLKGRYLTALPMLSENMDRLQAVWSSYSQAMAQNDATQQAKLTQELLRTVRATGSAALTKARADYQADDQQINQILQPRQIDAYLQGKTLAQ